MFRFLYLTRIAEDLEWIASSFFLNSDDEKVAAAQLLCILSFFLSLSLTSMDYERIDKVQTSVLSPTKLRMKLLGAQHLRKKEGWSSPRASPSKLEDAEYVKRNLLGGGIGEKESVVACTEVNNNQAQSSSGDYISQEILNTKLAAVQKIRRQSSVQIQLANNFCMGQPMRNPEESGGDSNGWLENNGNGYSSFEFHKEEKLAQNPASTSLYKHLPSKWNDAEKWIVNRQAIQENASRKSLVQYQSSRNPNPSCARIAPESMVADQKLSLIQSAGCNNNAKIMQEKFAFVAQGLYPGSVSSKDASCLTDTSQAGGDSVSLDLIHTEKKKDCDNADVTFKQSVSMRDVGTEMTPIPSHEPSRRGTPMENSTPNHSPIYSTPSSPRGPPSKGTTQYTLGNEKDKQDKGNKRELSERELQLKTRREIAALGFQLGKLNIASWASKEADHTSPSPKTNDEQEEQRKEYEARAAAWEEAESSKHMARFKREEVKILAWESHQIAKYETKMRKVEIRAKTMRSSAEAAMMEKLKTIEKNAEEKRSKAAARKNLQAATTSRQAELMRQSGHVPSSHVSCCSWFF
ncbi:hypothetical protein HPP92_018937 [Vanilla planifolia]|uniref:Remorin C-terminal domain-containing protein n=1 Tax=Vanilla planifolia TaxID=51239 RepID=A0A835Q4X1_VANPL|nr:hypothetical protein HPP92_018937 [Vanilla planifolia]